MKPGYLTSEFMATTAGMFIVTLLAMLAAFRIINITDAQRQTILDFASVSWIALPAVYTFARSWVKSRAAAPAAAVTAIAEAKKE